MLAGTREGLMEGPAIADVEGTIEDIALWLTQRRRDEWFLCVFTCRRRRDVSFVDPDAGIYHHSS